MALTRDAVLVLLSVTVCHAALIPRQAWNIRPQFSQFLPRHQALLETSDFDQVLLNAFSTSSKSAPPPQPQIKSLHMVSEIANRYASTVMTSRVVNPANVSQEVSFSVIIPETAFITGFQMEIAGKTYKAYVKEKEEAKREYAEAVHRGQAAAHVHQSARDSERFSVSVNVEAQSKVTFTLTYEELLQWQLGVYRHVININPGQIVPDLKVDVHIKEPRNITDLHAKEIQSANEIDSDVGENPNAQVEWINPNEAKIHFEADEKEQRRIEKLRKEDKKDSGLAGKFVVDYDVERDPTGNEVIVSDGYFVHFFAPKDLPAMRKHVLFVLDVSGSMVGRKIEQLQQAMLSILDQLKPEDHFNIIEFSYSVTVRNLDAEVNSAVYTPYSMYFGSDEPKEPSQQIENTESFPATPHYIEKAKAIIRKMTAGGGTNIYDALQTAIRIAKKGISSTPQPAETEENTASQLKKEKTHRPIIIFLTDGEPTVGETSLYKIQMAVNELNADPKSTIFSLAFGEGADFDFLKKISLANNGFARHIYEAADAEIQIRNFYNHISSPLLSDVKFIYSPDQVDGQTVTKRIFSDLFKGSELVIAGKIGSSLNSTQIEAIALDGPRLYHIPIPETKNKGFGSLERLWAYLTIRQLLDEDAIQSTKQNRYSYEADGPTTPKPNMTKPTPKESALKIALKLLLTFAVQLLTDTNEIVFVETTFKERVVLGPKERALNLALKYSFVCPLTSLVVVKPNGTTNDLNTESAAPGAEDGPIAPMAFQQSAVVRSGGPHRIFAASSHAQHSFMRPPQMGLFSNRMQMPMRSFDMMPQQLRGGPAGASFSMQGGRPALFAAFGQPMYQNSGFSKVSMAMGPMPLPYMPIHAAYPTTRYPGRPAAPPVATTLNVPQPESDYDRVDTITDELTEKEEATTENSLLDQLSAVPWLDAVRNGDQITLNTTDGLKTLNLKTTQNASDEACRLNDVEGKCQPLIHSKIEDIPSDLDAYVNEYLCELPGNVAGVCIAQPGQRSDVPSETSTLAGSTEASTEQDTEDTVTEVPQEETTVLEVVTEDATQNVDTTTVQDATETETSP